MKTVGVIIVILLIAVVLVVALSAIGAFCIGETLGITNNCLTPLCRNSSTLFDDLCSRCRNAVDGVVDFFR